jgi:hypothetical protein
MNKSIKIILAITLGVILLLVLAEDTFVNYITNKVVEKLQKEYSPSPYGPGFDPDKIDFEKILKTKK